MNVSELANRVRLQMAEEQQAAKCLRWSHEIPADEPLMIDANMLLRYDYHFQINHAAFFAFFTRYAWSLGFLFSITVGMGMCASAMYCDSKSLVWSLWPGVSLALGTFIVSACVIKTVKQHWISKIDLHNNNYGIAKSINEQLNALWYNALPDHRIYTDEQNHKKYCILITNFQLRDLIQEQWPAIQAGEVRGLEHVKNYNDLDEAEQLLYQKHCDLQESRKIALYKEFYRVQDAELCDRQSASQSHPAST